MKRLVQGLGKNTPEEYERIFFEREQKGVDPFDERRWKLLLQYFRKGKLIDLGCLDSLVTLFAKEKSIESECWGIDFSVKAIESMKIRYPSIYWEIGDVYKTNFPSNYFSYAVAGELLEHLEDPEKFLKETFRILKKGGILALSTPYDEKLNDVDGERHLWSFTIDDIRQMLLSYGQVKIQLFPKVHIPFTAYHHKNIIAFCTKR